MGRQSGCAVQWTDYTTPQLEGKGKLTGTEEPVVSDSDASQTDGQNMVSRICIMCSLAHLWAV